MLATNLSRRNAWRPLKTQAGTAAVEFALLVLMFLVLVFGIIELARLLFVFNTVHEVTRRAAAEAMHVYPRDTDAIAKVRQFAVFRSSPGNLVLANPVTDQHIRLDYLRSDLSVIPEGAWPADAATNRRICMSDPRAPTCIRFVQASICNPAVTDQCDKVTVQMLLSLIDMRVPLHRATTIVPVESLGYVPGTMPPAG